MPISIQYAPFAPLVGQAAYDVGYGEYLARQEAQQVQAERIAQQQAARPTPAPQQRQQQGRDDYLARYAIAQRAWDANAAREAQLAGYDLRGQYDLAQQQMANDQYLQREAMQQAGLWQREQSGNQSELERQRREMLAKQYIAQEQAIQKWINTTHPSQDEIDDAYSQLHAAYANSGAPLPPSVQPPPMPDWANPEMIWERDNAYWDSQGLPRSVPDENGMPSRRGMPAFGATKEGMEFQSGLKVNEEREKNAITRDRDEAEFNRRAIESERDLRYQQQNLNLKARGDAMSAKIDLQTKIATAQQQIAKLSVPGDDGSPAPDLTAAKDELKKMQDMLNGIVVPGEYQEPSGGGLPSIQPMTPGVGGATHKPKMPWTLSTYGAEYNPIILGMHDGSAVPYGERELKDLVETETTETLLGKWVLTPKGPRQLTADVIRKLKGG